MTFTAPPHRSRRNPLVPLPHSLRWQAFLLAEGALDRRAWIEHGSKNFSSLLRLRRRLRGDGQPSARPGATRSVDCGGLVG